MCFLTLVTLRRKMRTLGFREVQATIAPEEENWNMNPDTHVGLFNRKVFLIEEVMEVWSPNSRWLCRG